MTEVIRTLEECEEVLGFGDAVDTLGFGDAVDTLGFGDAVDTLGFGDANTGSSFIVLYTQNSMSLTKCRQFLIT